MWHGEQFDGGRTTQENVRRYLRIWSGRDYRDGIPDEVPAELMRENLAPSWKAIACALLKNDMLLTSLGFTKKRPTWYAGLKRAQVEAKQVKWRQLTLF